jgi:hypothetical protein
VTDQRIVLVHTVPFTDPDRLKQSCTSVAWVRKMLHDLYETGTTPLGDTAGLPARMEQLRDAQVLLDGLVLACLVELGADGTKT